MSLEEELKISYQHSSSIDEETIKKAFIDLTNGYDIMTLGNHEIEVCSQGLYHGRERLQIYPLEGSEIVAVDEIAKSKVNFSTATRNILCLYSDKFIYEIHFRIGEKITFGVEE